MWTNTCCSHPTHTESELNSNLENDFLGIRLAAIRRASFELGIEEGALKPEDLHVGARILYLANANETFAEYELDYIVFAKKDVKFKANPDEIKETKYVEKDELVTFLKERKEKFGEEKTPWFGLLLEKSDLMTWWTDIIQKDIEQGTPKRAAEIIKF